MGAASSQLDVDVGRAGTNQDRSQLVFELQGDTKSIAFNIMFALGEQLPEPLSRVILTCQHAMSDDAASNVQVSSLSHSAIPSSQRCRRQWGAMPRSQCTR